MILGLLPKPLDLYCPNLALNRAQSCRFPRCDCFGPGNAAVSSFRICKTVRPAYEWLSGHRR